MAWMKPCLTSLRNSSVPVDVLVLDNLSQDDTLARLHTDFPEVKVIANDANLGFGRANNIGIQHAIQNGYDAVLLLNQDAWIQPDTISKLVDACTRNPQYGILSPVHLTGSGQGIEHGFAEYIGCHELRNLPQEPLREVSFIDAAIWFLPIKTLKEVGLFAPIFYHYGEDKDLTNRMTHYGWKTGYLPQAFGHHAREHRKPTRAAFVRAESVYHLSEYTNINYSFPRSFALGVMAVGWKSAKALFRGRIKDASMYLRLFFHLLSQSGKVIKARRMSNHVNINNYV